MLFGTAEEGLHVVSQALPTDPVMDMKKYTAGMDQWQASGYSLTHGPAGYGYLRAAAALGRYPRNRLLPARPICTAAGLPTDPNPAPNCDGVAPRPPHSATSRSVRRALRKTIVISNNGTAAATNMAYPAAPAKFTKSGTCSGSTLNAGRPARSYSPIRQPPRPRITRPIVVGGGATMSISLSGTGVPRRHRVAFRVARPRCRSGA